MAKEETAKVKSESKKKEISKKDLQKIFGLLGRGLKGRELDKTPVSRTELNTQLSVLSAIIAELYMTVVAQGKDLRKRITYRIRLGGEIDLFITCDENKYKEVMRQLRKETTKLLKDLQPFNTMLGDLDNVTDDEDAPTPPPPQDRGYA